MVELEEEDPNAGQPDEQVKNDEWWIHWNN